jgi:hypothetical protein
MKYFDATKEKYNHLFKTVTLLINFLKYKHHQDFMFEVIGEHQDDPIKHGWGGDY